MTRLLAGFILAALCLLTGAAQAPSEAAQRSASLTLLLGQDEDQNGVPDALDRKLAAIYGALGASELVALDQAIVRAILADAARVLDQRLGRLQQADVDRHLAMATCAVFVGVRLFGSIEAIPAFDPYRELAALGPDHRDAMRTLHLALRGDGDLPDSEPSACAAVPGRTAASR